MTEEKVTNTITVNEADFDKLEHNIDILSELKTIIDFHVYDDPIEALNSSKALDKLIDNMREINAVWGCFLDLLADSEQLTNKLEEQSIANRAKVSSKG